ncbi:MAG TPA: orotate phosphoribosyltransferase [Candidatus Saccharimonadales bacterium]|nr:orotate phosphoribosyltransferase [Candidatus Saccharimonadales bacterium]
MSEIADILLGINAISINPKEPYRYASGILSPVYSDMRLLMSYPKQRREVIKAWINLIKSLGSFELIAATATAGIPHGAWISDEMDLPMVYVRGEAKGHGKKNQIEGLVKKGQRAIIVEDLISTGKSSIETHRALATAGAVTKNVAAIFNYTLPQSAANFKSVGVRLESLTTFPQVVETAVKKDLMKPAEKELVLDWLKDSAGWGKRHGFES